MSSRSNGVTNASSSRRVTSLVDLVAALLERLDARDARLEPVVLIDHLVEGRRRGREVLAVGDEQLEELRVLRQESKAHRDPSGPVRRAYADRAVDGSWGAERVEDDPGERGEDPGRRERQDPGDEDAPGDAPAHAPSALARARRP